MPIEGPGFVPALWAGCAQLPLRWPCFLLYADASSLPVTLKTTGSHEVHGFAAGPTGKILLMPEDPNAVFIMVATGTGIAPYRAFLRRMFVEDVPNYRFSGLAWLFMGVANSDAKLYDDEFQEILNTYPDQARTVSRVY